MSPMPVVVPGSRDVRGSLDAAGEGSMATGGAETPEAGGAGTPDAAGAGAPEPAASDACVVACPPHPELGGNRADRRLRAVSGALGARGVDCLRIDYGQWDEGAGELADATNAVEWARERYRAVGLFGYSFGGAIALLAAARGGGVRAVAALAPADHIHGDLDAVGAVDALDCPALVVYGERDDVVDADRVADAVRERGGEVLTRGADHHFVGQAGRVGEAVATFLAGHLE